jgi:hypothetical protein
VVISSLAGRPGSARRNRDVAVGALITAACIIVVYSGYFVLG